jgi:hypothetical protein
MVPVEQGVGHAGVHEVVELTPPVTQVTCPTSPLSQSRLVAVQVSPVQLTLPESQVAMHVAFRPVLGRFAAKTAPLSRVAQEPESPGWLKMAARASLVRGGWLGASAKATAETKRRAQAAIHAFFISFSSCSELN